MTRHVETVRGPVASRDLGPTSCHEHVFINWMKERRKDGLLNNAQVMVDELNFFVEQGGETVVDLTAGQISFGSTPDESSSQTSRTASRSEQNVRALVRVSDATGLNIVASTGHYRDPYLDQAHFDIAGTDGVAAAMIADIRHGFGATGVRAGVIGEIGTDKWYVSALEERLFRAAARASIATGVPVYTHAARWEVGTHQLDILQHEGLPTTSTAVGHVDTVPSMNYARALAERGAYLGIDTLNVDSHSAVAARTELVVALVERGHGHQLLLGHDICASSYLRCNGGAGFATLLGPLALSLRKSLDNDIVTALFVDNPREFLAPRPTT